MLFLCYVMYELLPSSELPISTNTHWLLRTNLCILRTNLRIDLHPKMSARLTNRSFIITASRLDPQLGVGTLCQCAPRSSPFLPAATPFRLLKLHPSFTQHVLHLYALNATCLCLPTSRVGACHYNAPSPRTTWPITIMKHWHMCTCDSPSSVMGA